MTFEESKTAKPGPSKESLWGRMIVGWVIVLTVATAIIIGLLMAIQHDFNQIKQAHERVVSECEAAKGTFSEATLPGTCTRDDGTVIIPSAIKK